MSRLTRITFASALISAAAIWTLAPVAGQGGGQPSTSRGEWPHYTADVKGTRYSPLDQVTAANFSKLEVAWRYKTDSLGPYPEYKLEGTPLMVNGVIYTTGGTRRAVVALDAKSGELIWVHSMREGKRAAVSPRQLSGRGVSYWTDGKGDERIIYVTTGYRLVALDAKTGQPIPAFGTVRCEPDSSGQIRLPLVYRVTRRHASNRSRSSLPLQRVESALPDPLVWFYRKD